MEWVTDYNYTWRDRYARWASRTAQETPRPQPQPQPSAHGRYVSPEVREQIRKLRTLAERTENPHEASVARERLREIFARYDLDERDAVA